jgi:hypothetical protein
MAIRGLSKLNIIEQNCTKLYIMTIEKPDGNQAFSPKIAIQV